MPTRIDLDPQGGIRHNGSKETPSTSTDKITSLLALRQRLPGRPVYSHSL